MSWRGPQKSSSSNPPALGRVASHQIRHQTKLSRAPSNLALITYRYGASKPSLGRLCQYFSTFIVINFLSLI